MGGLKMVGAQGETRGFVNIDLSVVIDTVSSLLQVTC